MASPCIVTCTACHMYSLSVSVSSEGFTCDKCGEIVRLTEKISELETRIQTLVEDSKNVRAVDTALDTTSSVSPVHCSVPVSAPLQQGNWATVRWHSRGSKHSYSIPIKTSNKFSPLSPKPHLPSPQNSFLPMKENLPSKQTLELHMG